jgi:predicted ATP-binding protein involved in virulence
MKLVRFSGTGIHGYLTINIKFNVDLTFITGINGSGKTSALNAIVALISPDLRMLANLQFTEIQLEVENNSEIIVVSASTTENGVVLLSSVTPDLFAFNKYVVDPELPTHRQLDGEAEHYRDVFATNSTNPVLKSLPLYQPLCFLGWTDVLALTRRSGSAPDFSRLDHHGQLETYSLRRLPEV